MCVGVCGDDGRHSGVEGFLVLGGAWTGICLEMGEGQGAIFVFDAHGPVLEMQKRDPGAAQRHSSAVLFDAVEPAAGAKGQAFGENALLAARQCLVQSSGSARPGARAANEPAGRAERPKTSSKRIQRIPS